MRVHDIPNRRLLHLLWLQIVLISALAVWKVPFSYPEGDIALNALSVLRTGHVQSTFLPAIYPYVMAHAYAWAGPAGFVSFQVLFFAALILLMRDAVRVGTLQPRSALFAAMLFALDPDLAASVPKAMDTLVTAVLLLLIVCVCLRAVSAKPAPGHAWRLAAALGSTWGFALAVRPNLALLAVPIAYGLRGACRRRWLLCWAASAAIAAGVLAAANTVAHGSFYLPHNGPYNFFAGANPFTAHALLNGYNAELSIPAAMSRNWPAGIALPAHSHDYYNARLNPTYTRLALGFIAHHPLQWLWLAVLKLLTLLRPSLRNHAVTSGSGIVEIVTSLITLLWLVLLVRARRLQRTLTPRDRIVDRLFLLTIGAYVLPFLLTNADPRFRTPLDALVLTHAAILIVRMKRCRAAPDAGEL